MWEEPTKHTEKYLFFLSQWITIPAFIKHKINFHFQNFLFTLQLITIKYFE